VRHRFYAPGISLSAPITLPDQEAEHLIRVLRLQAGDEVEAFDGDGGMFLAVVESAARRSAALRAVRVIDAAPEPGVRLRLVVAALKGDKTDGVVRDAAMLGVAAIQPVVSARSEIGLAALARSHRLQRWQRIAVSSVKQCGRAVVPTVAPALSLPDYLATPDLRPPHANGPGTEVRGRSRDTRADRLMLVEPSAAHASQTVQSLPRPAAADLMVGPEGGWADEEVRSAAAAGARLVTLGRRTLRADVAPLVGLTAVLTVWGEL
jgi:16S rRNA (uracil1498-N3)-methyltransferase